MIEIEKGIPIPPGRGRYPWSDMFIGDSFLIEHKVSIGAIRNGCDQQSRGGKKFVAYKRNFEDHGEAGVRVWRKE
jgi:hypothetical protein